MPRDVAVLHIEPGPQAEALEQRATFTTMTRAGPETWRQRQVALLVVDDEDGSFVDEVGLVTRSHQRVATGWHRLRYTREFHIEPVDVEELSATQPTRMQHRMASRLASDGVLPPATARATIKALERVRPDSTRALRKLLAEDRRTAPALRGAALQAAAHEADAVRLAVDIAGIPRETLGRTRPDGQVSYVERLADLRVAEDPAVAYDSLRFPRLQPN